MEPLGNSWSPLKKFRGLPVLGFLFAASTGADCSEGLGFAAWGLGFRGSWFKLWVQGVGEFGVRG